MPGKREQSALETKMTVGTACSHIANNTWFIWILFDQLTDAATSFILDYLNSLGIKMSSKDVSLKPGQVYALKKRQGDTWLTCLKFLIPVYALYYLIDRRTVTPWVTSFALSILVGIASNSTEIRAGVNVKASNYYDMSSAIAYILSPITMGIGVMKAKRYGKTRLNQAGISESQ